MGQETDASLGARVRQRLSAHLASRRFGDSPHIVVVGSGDAARSVLDALRQKPVAGAQVHVTSRTDQRAQLLADEFAIPVVPWERREPALREADAVVFAVHVTSPLVLVGFASTMPARGMPAVWVDLGVPGAVAAEFSTPHVQLISLASIDAEADTESQSAPWRAMHEARARRANVALQQELARYARAAHRHSLGARLGSVEEQALAVASSHGDAPVDEMVRKVTRLVLRELSRA
jgi:glutamyl-tRNA reductase